MRLRVRRFGFYSIEYRVYAVWGPWLKQDLRITILSPAARKRGYADLLDSWHRAFAAVVGESAKKHVARNQISPRTQGEICVCGRIQNVKGKRSKCTHKSTV